MNEGKKELKELSDEELDNISGGRAMTDREKEDLSIIIKKAKIFFDIEDSKPQLMQIRLSYQKKYDKAFDEYMNMMRESSDNLEEILFSDFLKNNGYENIYKMLQKV